MKRLFFSRMVFLFVVCFATLVVLISLSSNKLNAAPGLVGIVVDDKNTVITFDAVTDTYLGSVPIRVGQPGYGFTGDCTITTDGTRGFVTGGDGTVWVIDITTIPPTLAPGTNPIAISNRGKDITITSDQKFLLVTGGTLLTPISVIDIASRSEIGTFSLGYDHNSIEALNDNSVLVTSSHTGNVYRLTIDGAGNLTNTGEVLYSGGSGVDLGPNNVFGAANATSGIVVRREANEMRSFTIPGLTLVDVRPLSGLGISGLVNASGDHVYVRSNNIGTGNVDAFEYDAATGKLGSSPLFTIPVFAAKSFYGMDQMAISPDGAKLYVSEWTGSLSVYDADTGNLLTAITGGAINRPTGVCLPMPVVQEIKIDIKPGSDPNSINCQNEKGVITVAVMTTADFDATTVDHATVTFEGASETHVDKRSGEPRRHEEDVDGDGDVDLVFHFRLGDTSLTCESTEGMLTGETAGGASFEGVDAVRMVNR